MGQGWVWEEGEEIKTQRANLTFLYVF